MCIIAGGAVRLQPEPQPAAVQHLRRRHPRPPRPRREPVTNRKVSRRRSECPERVDRAGLGRAGWGAGAPAGGGTQLSAGGGQCGGVARS